MSSKSKFTSRQLGRHLTLSFERIADSYWTHVGALREFMAELDRLGVSDQVDVRLIHRDALHELQPVGWSLSLWVVDDPQATRNDEAAGET
jgi:hypothetical protein